MNYVLVGISHKTSCVDVREKFFLTDDEKGVLLTELKFDPRVVEAFVLSTCNRTEIYAHLINDEPDVLFEKLFALKNLTNKNNFEDYFYVKRDSDFIYHLFAVACGLDSLVLGEKQILGQLKNAAELARQKRTLNKIFNILLNICIATGKTVQAKTSISSGGSSISWAAVATAQRILKTLDQKSILIIGAGKMSQLTAGQLLRKSVSNIFVANRTFQKAKELAHKIGGKAVMFWDLKNILIETDACICSAGANYFLIEPEAVAEVMRLRLGKPLLLIDISTPRNINPKVAEIPGVHLITIDDLQNTVQEHYETRKGAVMKVETIIREKISFFFNKVNKGSYILEASIN